MTLIVGIKCKDGIVIAADGAATYAGAGGPTIRQPTRKISLIHNQAVMAVCGAVGLAQQYRGVVTEKLGNPNRYKSDVQAGNRAVRDALLPIYEQEAKAAMIQTQLKGQRSSC